jgi:signal transduction histidine kinase
LNLKAQLGTTSFGGRWLLVLSLLIGVLAPTACVLWFLNVAVNNDRDASRRKLEEAYRGQLKLLRGRIDSWWDKRAADLERESRGGDAVVFERIVTQGLADSVITPGYPSMSASAAADPVAARPDWIAARLLESQSPSAAADSWAAIASREPDVSIASRALQARVRCLVRAGNRAAAIQTIEENFTSGRYVRGRDLEGRFIALDEQLFAIRLIDPGHTESARRRLHDLVADYAGLPIPSTQRLFLMEELGPASFPTYKAERLAAQFLESGRSRTGDGALEPAGVPDVWKFTPAGTPLIALFHTPTAIAGMRSLSAGLNVALSVTPPGSAPPAADESMAAGSALPGWQISISMPGQEFDAMAKRRVASYVWIGLLAISFVAVSALAAGQLLRHHWQIATLKTDLVAAVSHELKTPVASVRVLVDTLLTDEQPNSEKTRDYLELIAQENRRLSRLIENFLTFSRLERNRQKFEFTEVDPVRVVEAAMTMQSQSASALSVLIAPNLPRIRADEDALVTVLRNLLDNAWKYTPGEKRIALRAYRENARVVFAVEDNGIGIAPSEQKRIFRRFYQVDRRLTRDAGGCGLGLSIVEFIVRAHGGAIRVQSQPGQGSTFFVTVPEAA